jgi:hypothetical protein
MALMEIIQWIGQLSWFSLGGCLATGDYEIFKGMDSFKCFWFPHRVWSAYIVIAVNKCLKQWNNKITVVDFLKGVERIGIRKDWKCKDVLRF